MSCDEIRYWLVSLRQSHGWRVVALSRYLGFPDKGAMTSKLRSSWIYPGEQLRVSKALHRIITGEIVCEKVTARRWEAVVATTRVPLREPMRLKIDLTTGRLGFTAPRITARATGIPSFAALGG